ncbi:hypothetical protein M434DRAFT_377155 [Hypoxylon sp. CO27-5]|nr:hypothetical protein M434DRAFT_377155 [Hypoxylon sp. CO27-5]
MATNSRPMYSDTPLAVMHTPKFETGKTDAFTLEASKMALSHNSFIRGFNSIYQQAHQVSAEDKPDFVAYCIAWHDCADAHHCYEEEEFFPNVNKAAGRTDLMDTAVHEHAAFHEGMERFKDPLYSHLKAEPPSIVALAKYSTPERPIDILAIADTAAKNSITLSMVFNVLPVFYLNMDFDFEGGMWEGVFPSFKGTGRWLLTKAIPTWHSRRWSFASYSPDRHLSS